MVIGAADIYSEGGDASSEPGNVKESLKDVIYINKGSLQSYRKTRKSPLENNL